MLLLKAATYRTKETAEFQEPSCQTEGVVLGAGLKAADMSKYWPYNFMETHWPYNFTETHWHNLYVLLLTAVIYA